MIRANFVLDHVIESIHVKQILMCLWRNTVNSIEMTALVFGLQAAPVSVISKRYNDV